MNVRIIAGCFLLGSIICSASSALGLNPMKKLEVMIRADGAVVFVKPAKMPCVTGGGKAMEFDWTMTTLTDSVSLTYTIVCETSLPVDSVRFVWNTPERYSFSCATEKIYEEPKGDKWVYRRRALLSKDEFDRLARSPLPPDVEAGNYIFRMKSSQWKDCALIYNTAIEIINRNKK